MDLGNDRPIVKAEEDKFGRNVLAKTLATYIKQSPSNDSFVIGLLGAWGSGKTSILNILENHLEDENTLVVKFNPWYFTGTEQLVQFFFEELFVQLKKSPGNFNNLGNLLTKYSEALDPIKYVPFFGTHAGQVLEGLKALGNFLTFKAQKKDGINGIKEEIKAALLKSKKRIVVFIDDIDRLEPEEIREILRLVRLVGDFPYMTYVLAYDDQQVQASLRSLNIDSKNYLEKIVQVTCHVPMLREVELATFLAIGIESLFELNKIKYNSKEFIDLFNPGLRNLFKTPRDVKRYLGGLQITLPSLCEEINPVDIVGIEAIRILFPDTFRLIPQSFDILTGTDSTYGSLNERQRKKQLEGWNLLVESAGDKQENVKKIISDLFVLSQRITNNTGYGSEWFKTWEVNKKISHPKILSIYLERSLPSGVLPYSYVSEVFESLTEKDALQILIGPLDGDQFEHLCERIIAFQDKFTDKMFLPTIEVFCENSFKFASVTNKHSDFGPEQTLRSLIYQFLKKIPEDIRVLKLNEVLDNTSIPLSWKLVNVEQIGYSKGMGHKLVSRDDAQMLEIKMRQLIIEKTNEQLILENQILRILIFLKRGDEKSIQRFNDYFSNLKCFSKYLLKMLSISKSQFMGKASVTITEFFPWTHMNEFLGEDLLKEKIELLQKEKFTLTEKENHALAIASKYISGELVDTLRPYFDEEDD